MENTVKNPEGFEAWFRQEYPVVAQSTDTDDWPCNDLRACWQAALAQQGREVDEPVAWLCKAEARVPPTFVESEAVARDTYERVGYNITPLYTAAPKQQAVEVTEEMVERAWKAATLACVVKGRYRAPVAPNEWFAALRAALLAALPGKTEVERG